MKTQSRKNKGRKLQQWVVKKLIEVLEVDPEDVKSTSMGAGGEDVILSKAGRKAFPYSVECKNQERVNLWSSWEQAVANSGRYQPLLIVKKNRQKPLAILDAEHFIEIQGNVR